RYEPSFRQVTCPVHSAPMELPKDHVRLSTCRSRRISPHIEITKLLSVKNAPAIANSRGAGRRRRRLAVLTAATAAAASCGATLGPATPALAGGVPGRVCPAGARVDIHAGDESPPSPPTHVDPGFYAQTGLYWPPTTAIACRVGAGVGHPLLKLARNGCAAGKLGFLIPDDTASPTG